MPQLYVDLRTESSQSITIQGKVVSSIHSTETLLHFDFQTEEPYGLIRVHYFQPNPHEMRNNTIQYGAICELNGELRVPEGSSNPGQFNYNKYLASHGISYEMIISSMDDINCQDEGILNSIYKLREHMKKLLTNKFSEESSAWILALVVGDDRNIPEETIELFQRWGLSHILAISGLHIGLVVGILYFISIKLNIVTRENAQYLVIFALPVYALLAGGEPSVWRASLMILLVIILQKFKQKFSISDVISITFLGLLLVNPYYMYHVGFQLSFIVSFGIILSQKWLLQGNSIWLQMIKLSFISQLIIIPLQVIYFFNVNPLSILLNVLVVPYFTFFVIPMMFFLLAILPIRQLAESLDSLFRFVHHDVFLPMLEWLDHYVYFPWFTSYFPTIIIVVYYALLIAMMYNLHLTRSLRAFSYGVILTLLLIGLVTRPYLSPYGTVTMLDIGQGDAIVIELPFRRGVFLVDAGAGFSYEDMEPSDSIYQRIIKPFLHSRGIGEIDAIVISHEDIDHAGSVPFILEDFKVGAIIVSKYYEFNPELLEKLAGIELIRVASGDELRINEKMFTFLSPGVDRKGSNENSLVFHMKLGDKDWLFTGDTDMEAEKAILTNYSELQVDVLKVAHHGSNTSSNSLFITSINPRYALISVGKNNRYGHPSNEVLSLFEAEGIQVLRTDQSGAIMYRYTEDSGTFYHEYP
nr:DNA internalization-related competence protein ComEC/Rec2 [Ornithinibacillus scapharcae]